MSVSPVCVAGRPGARGMGASAGDERHPTFGVCSLCHVYPVIKDPRLLREPKP